MVNTTKIDPVMKRLVGQIIDHWGVTMAAKDADAARPQNAASWRKVGNIPPRYRKKLLGAAREFRIKLDDIEVAYLESRERFPTFEILRDRLAGGINDGR